MNRNGAFGAEVTPRKPEVTPQIQALHCSNLKAFITLKFSTRAPQQQLHIPENASQKFFESSRDLSNLQKFLQS